MARGPGSIHEDPYLKFLERAKRGDAIAQVEYGTLMKTQRANYKEALKWYRRAAKKGNTRAYLNIGFMYMDGLGVPKDRQKALGWFQKAQKAGDKDAEPLIRLLSENPVR